MFTEIFIN